MGSPTYEYFTNWWSYKIQIWHARSQLAAIKKKIQNYVNGCREGVAWPTFGIVGPLHISGMGEAIVFQLGTQISQVALSKNAKLAHKKTGKVTWPTRGFQKVRRPTQLTTRYTHHNFVTFRHILLQLKFTWSRFSPKFLFRCRRIVVLGLPASYLPCRLRSRRQKLCVLSWILSV